MTTGTIKNDAARNRRIRRIERRIRKTPIRRIELARKAPDSLAYQRMAVEYWKREISIARQAGGSDEYVASVQADLGRRYQRIAALTGGGI